MAESVTNPENDPIRQSISLAEAYMSGSFSKTDNDDELSYPDYMDASILYTESIQTAHEMLRSSYGNTSYIIQGWRPFDIQMALYEQSKEIKIDALTKLTEVHKAQLQNIRLYDFIKGINMPIPVEAQELSDNCKTSEEYDLFMNSDFCKKLNEEGECIKKNRLAIGTAMKSLKVDDLLEAYKQPLYFTGTSFVSLTKHIEKSIASIQKDEIEDLLDNQSRSHAECCIC